MRKKDFGIWNEYTWTEVFEHVRRISCGLHSLEFGPGDKAAILGDNDPQWFWAEWAVQCVGGIAVGIYLDCMAEEVRYYLEHSDSSVVFVRDQEQADKVLEVQDRLPRLKRIVFWDPRGLWFYREPKLMALEALEEKGDRYHKRHPAHFDTALSAGRPEDVACFCYTSGTTGRPKAAMLSHGNLLYAVKALQHYNDFFPSDRYVSYISPAWVTEQMLGIAGGVAVPFALHFPEKPETVQQDLRDIAPSVVFYGARLWENLSADIQVRISDSTRIKQLTFNAAMRLARRRLERREAGVRVGMLLQAGCRLADFLVFRPLRDRIGMNRNRVAYTAGAAISPDMLRFFHALGVNIKNLYGSTEASLVSLQKDGELCFDSVGKPFPGCQVNISETGEILVKNDGVFLGYYKDPEATAKELRDGFYHTGDAGFFNGGHLHYIDRLSEMIELSCGSRVSPQFAEIRLRASPYVRDAAVFAELETSLISAILNIDFENVGKWAESRNLSYTTYLDLSQKPQVLELLRDIVRKVNESLPEPSRIQAFVSLHKEFDADEAELTRTRKLKRKPIRESYAPILQAMCQGSDCIRVESRVTYRDGRVGNVKTDLRVCYPEEGETKSP